MGLRKTTEAIAERKAIEIAEACVSKMNSMLTTINQSNIGKIEEVVGPNQFKVKLNGKVQTVTYTGFRPVSANSKLIVDGKFAR